MKMLLVAFLFMLSSCINQPFQRFKDYQEYLNEWRKIVPQKHIHNMTDLALQTQTCNKKKCQFYYYEYQDTSISNLWKRTILFVSGMHGDEFLGPHTLLYAYKHLKADRIIYFPMANPSGFIKEQRYTYPANFDTYKDFPFDGHQQCYRTTSSRILDKIYRTYTIDLTIILRNGATHIGFNWGTKTHEPNSRTVDNDIYMGIAQLLQKAGGQFPFLQLPKFPIGPMNDHAYSTRGSFLDWAYGSCKYPQLVSKCLNYEFEPYPQNMTNGLAFVIELGPFRVNSQQMGTEQGIKYPDIFNDYNNGYVSRAIRMLKQVSNIFTPHLEFIWSNNSVEITVKGCQKAVIEVLTFESIKTNTVILELKQQTIDGDVQASIPKARIFNLTSGFKVDELSLKGRFECDPHWQGIGTTFFSNKRIYSIGDNYRKFTSIKHKEQAQEVQQPQLMKIEKIDNFVIDYDDKDPYFFVYIAIALLMVLAAVYIIVMLKKRQDIDTKKELSQQCDAEVTQTELQK